MSRVLSLEDARRQYVHRFTMDHVPDWAKKRAPNGKYYAPQYSSDEEWYNNTLFYGESELASRKYCYTSGRTWPLGHWLDKPYSQQECRV